LRSNAYAQPFAPPPVILTEGKDPPAKPLLDAEPLGFGQALRAGILRSGSE
jgi:hypothetical protein